ncbi:carbonic anhydrase [Rhizobium sp. FKL33]|jgi:carbonic anhydrase|uniref:carbonic anhydrase n=1 Tax=Rhizobium sp. FKL33 TaxID=2562307 RepID=UPI0010C088CC|nr:carbonic anhydrase [Rhizobium sp. FKL33]
MCLDCLPTRLSRRNMMKFAGLSLAAASMPITASASESKHAAPNEEKPADAHKAEAAPAISPEEALARLKEGNARFVNDADACAANLASRREELVAGQHPWAIILTCSDSRVTPELVFGGVTLGELFVIRNAGNVLDTSALGTIEYGAEHLHAPLIVVMGHKKCGAVAAACDVVQKGTQLEGSIGKMVQPILPVALHTLFKSPDFVAETVANNAISGAHRIPDESHIVSHLVESGKVKIVSAVYDIESGKVDFLEGA